MLHCLLVRLEVDAGHTQVVAAPHKPRAVGEGFVICGDSLLGPGGELTFSLLVLQPLLPVGIGQGRSEPVPEEGVLRSGGYRGSEAIHSLVKIPGQVEQNPKAGLSVI